MVRAAPPPHLDTPPASPEPAAPASKRPKKNSQNEGDAPSRRGRRASTPRSERGHPTFVTPAPPAPAPAPSAAKTPRKKCAPAADAGASPAAPPAARRPSKKRLDFETAPKERKDRSESSSSGAGRRRTRSTSSSVERESVPAAVIVPDRSPRPARASTLAALKTRPLEIRDTSPVSGEYDSDDDMILSTPLSQRAAAGAAGASAAPAPPDWWEPAPRWDYTKPRPSWAYDLPSPSWAL